MELGFEDHIQQQILWYGWYEKQYLIAWENMVRPDSVVVDAGANAGYYSIAAAAKAKGGKIYSFEPAEPAWNQLLRNIEINHFQHVSANRLALGNRQGNETLYLSSTANSGMSALQPPENFEGETANIEMTTLDHWLSKNSITRLDLVKIDIEGAELQALKGMQETLLRFKPVLFIEVCSELLKRSGSSVEELYTFLQINGYEAWKIMLDSSLQKTEGLIEDELVVFQPAIAK
jgi:FkbM family methyltransferase